MKQKTAMGAKDPHHLSSIAPTVAHVTDGTKIRTDFRTLNEHHIPRISEAHKLFGEYLRETLKDAVSEELRKEMVEWFTGHVVMAIQAEREECGNYITANR
ncbi:MAG: hypothetical protein K8H89_11495 [Flavobacteriales bacterium]|jgi:hypothetical protein|nr:hypothetical protein [Flavobacteriales bacterium]